MEVKHDGRIQKLVNGTLHLMQGKGTSEANS